MTMNDRSFGLFEPDALLPAQFYAAFRGGTGVSGEKRLMLAVLQDALDCYQKYAIAKDGPGRQLFAEAEEWISDESRGWYFSFENICEILEINSDYLRGGMRRWRQGLRRDSGYCAPQASQAPASSTEIAFRAAG